MRILMALAVAILLSSNATASCDARQCTSTVKLVYTTGAGDGRVHVQLNESMAALNCYPAENVFYTLHESHKRFDEIYDAVNLALITGRKIRLRINEGSNNCSIAYSILY